MPVSFNRDRHWKRFEWLGGILFFHHSFCTSLSHMRMIKRPETNIDTPVKKDNIWKTNNSIKAPRTAMIKPKKMRKVPTKTIFPLLWTS